MANKGLKLQPQINAAEIQRRIQEGTDKVQPRPYISLQLDTYVGTKSKALFIDSEFGPWEAIVEKVLRGGGHIKRARKRLDPKEILKRIQGGYKDIPPRPFISFQLQDFWSITNKITFTDVEYGPWEARPSDVMLGGNHPRRAFGIKLAPEIEAEIQKDRPFITFD